MCEYPLSVCWEHVRTGGIQIRAIMHVHSCIATIRIVGRVKANLPALTNESPENLNNRSCETLNNFLLVEGLHVCIPAVRALGAHHYRRSPSANQSCINSYHMNSLEGSVMADSNTKRNTRKPKQQEL